LRYKLHFGVNLPLYMHFIVHSFYVLLVWLSVVY